MQVVFIKFLSLFIKVLFFAIMAYIGIRIGIMIRNNKTKKENLNNN